MNHDTYVYEGGRPDRAAGHGILHVIVKDGVTSIDDFAFSNWGDLVSVHVTSSVTTIGEGAFSYCSSLSSINLPESLQIIGQEAFSNCTTLSQIILPDSLTEIGRIAFCVCSSLSSITIPPSITRIEHGTFSGCSSLSQVTIPPSVTFIEEYGFSSCERLKSIQLPNTLETIGNWAFNSCTSLESIHIPTSVTHIGYGTFVNCTSLKLIYTPSSALKGVNVFSTSNCNINNLIILTDTNHFYYDEIPSITLHNIQQCIHYLPNDIPPNQQLHALHHSLQQQFPQIAQRAQQYSLNLLHLLVCFPGTNDDIYRPLLTLLTMCPQAMTTVDSSGRTPLHHVMTSTRHIMDDNSYELLLDHCPDTVVHLAMQSVILLSSSSRRWDDVRDMVYVKMDALSVEDVESGLLPFMIVAEGSDDVVGLNMVYELLCLNPGVLKEYTYCAMH